MNILGKAEAIGNAIDTKVQTAQLCKDIVNALVTPTKALTQKLIKLKELYPEKYAELEPTLKDFLSGNQENINAIGQYLINSVLHIADDIQNFEDTSSDTLVMVNAKPAITHLGNSLFDVSRHDFLSNKEFICAIADAVNNKTKSASGYMKVKPYTNEDIEFTYKGNLVRLRIANIMQQIGRQKTGSLGKGKEGYEAFLQALVGFEYKPIAIENTQAEEVIDQSSTTVVEALMPIEHNRLPLTIKNDKTKLYLFLTTLRASLSDKITSQHFVNIKPTNPDIAKLELSIIVDNNIIKNTVHNIYNSLSKLFFGKTGNFAAVHKVLVDLKKMEQDVFWNTYPLVQEIEQENKKSNSTNNAAEIQKEFISTLDLQQAYMNIVEKQNGRQNLDKFFEHYNLREDQFAINKLQNYKIILRQFITELQKFTKNKELIEEVRTSINVITDKELRAAHNYIKEHKHAGPIQMIIDIVKKYNDRK